MTDVQNYFREIAKKYRIPYILLVNVLRVFTIKSANLSKLSDAFMKNKPIFYTSNNCSISSSEYC